MSQIFQSLRLIVPCLASYNGMPAVPGAI
jgi:hypothetical protein